MIRWMKERREGTMYSVLGAQLSTLREQMRTDASPTPTPEPERGDDDKG